MKILIIDDDEMLKNVWSLAMTKEGNQVFTASAGRAGIEIAKKEMPDFILLDQIMPDMKGNEVLALLKQDPVTQNIPVAIASNYSENELMQDAIQKGAVDYILKYQIDPQDLLNKIKSLSEGTKASA